MTSFNQDSPEKLSVRGKKSPNCFLVLVGEEHEAEFADLDLVASGERLRVARLAVDVGAVEGLSLIHI